MKRVVLIAAVIAVAHAGMVVATTAPKDGGPLPQHYRDRLASDKTAYQMQRAWINKVRTIKEARDLYLDEQVKAHGPQALSAPLPAQFAVSGTIQIPVFAGYFLTQSAPYTAATLQNKLFDNLTGTVTDYYDEVSYGNLNLTGATYGWTQLASIDAYYAGTGFGLEPATDRTGEFIKELLDAHDGAVDFGQYDNDGPDGVPNSGDDDGFVDVAAFVHNEIGAECGGNTNIWSHRWVYRGWSASGGQPYTTNDARSGGGFIKVDDYTIMPARNCDNSTIDIGVFCHEFGHAFGLPDLYDTNGAGNGIGYWGIMGSGNWNSPSSPAHPCAWTREVLGWITPTVVDWTDAAVNIPDVNSNAVAFKLPFTDDRFRRSTACAINGSYSLYCGLPLAEENLRNFAAAGPGGGYGSNWVETIERDFTYNGSGAVTLAYNFDHDIEVNYDYAYAVIEVSGAETILRTYTGAGSGGANIDISSHLAPLSGAGGTYTLKFRVVSDFSFNDEDGNYNSTCGALAIDDVSVNGGGETYSSDFETYADGWHQDPAENPSGEYWLVENRRATGFDANLLQPGLVLMHVDQSVMWAPFLGNSGGTGSAVRGLVVEEADGDFDLNGAVSNRGETTDPFPGTSGKTSFTSVTTPGSGDNTTRTTRIQLTSISAAAPTMSANMRAGDPAPQASSVSPPSANNDQTAVSIAVTGDLIRHGATFHFVPPIPVGSAADRTGADALADVVATAVEWVDPTRLVGEVNLYGVTAGDWDLVVTNPDGQTVVMPGALTVNFIVATQLQSATVRPVAGAIELVYELYGQEPGEKVRLYRSTDPQSGWQLIEDDLRGDARGLYSYRDEAVAPGTTYYYRLATYLDGDERELHRASALVPTGALALSQNVPNPFNPTTSIGFFLPEKAEVSLQIYDISGALVRELATGPFDAGPHDVQWNGRDRSGNAVASGVYFYRLITANRTLTRKMVLLK